MTLKCPNCGQLLKSEPGKRGMCPYCKTEVVFPDGDPMTGEVITCPHCGQNQRYRDGLCINCGKEIRPKGVGNSNTPLPLNVRKKKSPIPKIIFAFIAVLILAVSGVFLSIKFSRDAGPISLGMSENEVFELSHGATINQNTEEMNFHHKCPLLLFAPEVLYSVDFSVRDNTVQKIRTSFFGTPSEAELLYNALSVALSIKYGHYQEYDALDISHPKIWRNDTSEVTLEMAVWDEQTAFLSLEIQDTESYEYQVIQDGYYTTCEVPAYEGKLLDSYGGIVDGVQGSIYVHKAVYSESFSVVELISLYEMKLEAEGFEKADWMGYSWIEDGIWDVYVKGTTTVTIMDDEENKNNIIIMCEEGA